jgi:hypothetical protein
MCVIPSGMINRRLWTATAHANACRFAHALVSPRALHDQHRSRVLAPPVKAAEPGRPERIPGREIFQYPRKGLWLPGGWFPLLPGHGDPEPFLRVDEVVGIIFADIDLHPIDLARGPAVAAL